MATYYVDSVNGLDANNGLGPDASAGTNKPWKTIAKLLGASGMASGDTAYLSPAGPFREAVTMAMTSPTVETKITADPGNAQGFKTSGGVAVAPGPVRWTTWLTNDKTPGAAGIPLTVVGRDFLTFDGIMFQAAGANVCVTQASGDALSNTFRHCVFLPGLGQIGVKFDQASVGLSTFLIDQCIFVSAGATALQLRGPLNPTGNADYDIGAVIENTLFLLGGGAVAYTAGQVGGSGTGKPGGEKFRNNTVWGGANGIVTVTNHSVSIPVLANNCLFAYQSSTCLSAGASTAQIVEDYNVIHAGTPRGTGVAAGAHSVSDASYAPMLHLGQERFWGMLQRPLGEPMSGSPLLGFGNDGTQTSYDGLNRPRPAGGASASPGVGWLERGNTAAQATSPAPAAGTHVWQGTGPWYQDFHLPVSAAATTVSVDEQHDANYTGTKPSLVIIGQAEIGVSDQTITSSGSSGANNTLTSASFTPTATGFIKVRVVSSDTSGSSVVSFSNFVIT